MNKIILKMNSTFGTIGKAMTDKLTEKLTAKTSFRFSVKRSEKYLNNMQSHMEERFPNLVIFFRFRKGLFFLFNFLLRFFHLVAVFVNFRN